MFVILKWKTVLKNIYIYIYFIIYTLFQFWCCLLPCTSYFLDWWQPGSDNYNDIREQSQLYFKRRFDDSFSKAPQIPSDHTYLLLLHVLRKWEYGRNCIVAKLYTSAASVNVLLLKVITAQHRESRRTPVLPLHIQEPFLKFSFIVQWKPVA